MAQLSFTIPDNQVSRVQDAFCAKFGYTGTDPNGAAETKNQFVKRVIVDHVKRTVQEYETEQAAQAAATTASQAATVDVT